MSQKFSNRTYSNERGAHYEYRLEIDIRDWSREHVTLEVENMADNPSDNLAIARMTPTRARAIAQDLNAAADFIDAYEPEEGEHVRSIGQLNNLPRGTVLIGNNGRPFAKGDNPYKPNEWTGFATQHQPYDLLVAFGPLKVVYLPEVIA